MLPLPFENYIPYRLRKNITVQGQAFIDKIDDLITEIKDEILELYFLKDPFRTPVEFLEELGFYLNAGIFSYDSESLKRKKIAEAVSKHKKSSLWEYDAKIRIDDITGYDSALFADIYSDDWILTGDSTDISSYYWGALGADGIDDDLGLALIGEGNEVEIKGNIYIDLHPSIDYAVLTNAVLAQVVYELEQNVAPAYYRIILGYTDSSGEFVAYMGSTRFFNTNFIWNDSNNAVWNDANNFVVQDGEVITNGTIE